MNVILNKKVLSQFLDRAVETLKGEWLLVGGTLLPAVGLDVRATVDIDLVGLSAKESAQSLELMKLVEELKLPVESVNQAAAFFVHRAGYTKSDLLPLRQSRKCVIYRPSVLLYWKLKLARMTETDAIDCQHYLNYCIGQGDVINRREMNKALRLAAQTAASQEALERILGLANAR